MEDTVEIRMQEPRIALVILSHSSLLAVLEFSNHLQLLITTNYKILRKKDKRLKHHVHWQRAFSLRTLSFLNKIYVCIYLFIWGWGRNIDLLFSLLMHWLVDSCMSPTLGSNPQPWRIEGHCNQLCYLAGATLEHFLNYKIRYLKPVSPIYKK